MRIKRVTARRRAPRLVAAAAVLLVTACGSVVKAPPGFYEPGVAGAAGVPVAPGAGVAAGPALGGESATGTASSGGSAPLSQTSGAVGSASSGGAITGLASGPASGPATGPIPPADGPGVTATEIHIGIPVASDTGSIYKSLGSSSGAPTADEIQAQALAIVGYINAHGGAAGRHLVADFYLYSEGSGTFTSQGQEICEHFTKDDQVLLVLATGNNTQTLADCLAAAGVVLLDVGNSEIGDNQLLNALAPYYYRPFNANLDVFGTVIDTMVADGVLKAGDRVGDIRFDLPQYDRAMDDVIKPALARHGITLIDDYEYSYIDSVADLGTSSAETNNAILKFRTDDIDHVLLVGTQGVVPFFFMPAADSQNYHPVYVGSSMDIPGFMVVNVPADQMANFYGLGWNVVYDLDWNGVFSHANIPQWNQCIKIMGSTGTSVEGFSCDPYMFVAAALNQATVVSASGFGNGVARLGTSFATGQTLSLNFRPGGTDGVGEAREFEYSAPCKCEVYTGPPVAIQ